MRTRARCSTCGEGPCAAGQACLLPIELQPIKRRIFAARRRWLPTTREAWGRFIGASLGLGGFWLFAREALQRLFP